MLLSGIWQNLLLRRKVYLHNRTFMYVPFESLPPQSRVWIYQSDKLLTKDQQSIISEGLRSFTEQWSVHGSPIETSFRIAEDHFVILAANDETSGCSIDSSVRAMRNLGDQIGVDFFNRNLVAFHIDGNVRLVNLKELKTALSHGTWSATSLHYNNLVQTVNDLSRLWRVAAKDTWLCRYFDKQTA
jgi:hypothetical protein